VSHVLTLAALVFIFVMIKSHLRQARKPVASSTSLSPQSSAVTLMQGSQTGMLRHYWRAHGRFVARYSVWILMVTAVLVCVCTLLGIRFLKIEQDPVKLWVSPNSRTAVDQDYFNKVTCWESILLLCVSNLAGSFFRGFCFFFPATPHNFYQAFGAFYRVEQLIITTNTSVPGGESSNVTQIAVLMQALALQQHLQEAIGVYQVGNQTLSVAFEDLCFRPVYGQGCLIESPLEWWQSNASALLATNRTGDYFNACGQVPLNCMSSIGTPIDANVVLGTLALHCQSLFHAVLFVSHLCST
jgi:Niemann-Pick C1 protein